MLHEIHIQNYAVIESLSVEFHPGLNILSGETGSGKSILVDALGLALGGRGSPDVIRTGQDRATVTAVFRAERNPPWSGWLEEYGLAGSGEPEVILRREIQASGKSRLLVNDQPVTVAAVKALGPYLVEVHGQSEHVALLARDAQLDLLDQFANVEGLLHQVGELAARRRELEREMESLSQNEQDRLRTIDLLSFQAQELEHARLEPGEDVRLEDEKRVLANLEKIRAAATNAFSHLYEEEGSACSRLAVVGRALEELRRYDAAMETYLEPLAGTRATLEDLAFFLRDYLGKLQANPQRLEELEDRLALIDRLKRKYGRTIEDVLAYGERIQQQLASLEHADERRSEVARKLEKVAAEYLKAARELSQERREAARKLERHIREELAQLGMEKARFQVHFELLPVAGADLLRSASMGGTKGIDQVELRISPNPGEELRPLEKIASGGELSRLMLALKTVVGKARSTAGPSRRVAPTFIFDEVDAGIGGRIAESVGQRLQRLARDAQVLCVTHLAQIACFAHHHFYVEKLERAGRTATSVKYLEGEKERAAELARMLSGRQISEAVLKHAAAMLKQAAGTPA
jgi:DNA repair protein RecN (Recombination protein N)